MDILTKFLYLGLLLICAGFFYLKGRNDGFNSALDKVIEFIKEYDKQLLKVLKK